MDNLKGNHTRTNGKPNENLLCLPLWNKDINELKQLRKLLSNFYSDNNLLVLDKWIEWKSK